MLGVVRDWTQGRCRGRSWVPDSRQRVGVGGGGVGACQNREQQKRKWFQKGDGFSSGDGVPEPSLGLCYAWHLEDVTHGLRSRLILKMAYVGIVITKVATDAIGAYASQGQKGAERAARDAGNINI